MLNKKGRLMKNKNNLAVFAMILICSGCVAAAAPIVETYQTYSLGKSGVKAAQSLQPIGLEEEKAIGGSLAIQVVNKFGGVYPNQDLQRYIATLGRAVADVSDRPDIEYYFAVLNSEHPNAFATPGGYVFISVGLLRMLENESQLAGVLAHEISHITHRHALQTIEKSQRLASFGALTIGALGADPAMFDKVLEEAAEALFTKGLEKGMEFEADKMGTEYAYRLGYRPDGLKNFLSALKGKLPKEGSALASTHPSPQERVSTLSGSMGEYSDSMNNPVLQAEFKTATNGKL
jgi:predicted Zn-dependent protease